MGENISPTTAVTNGAGAAVAGGSGGAEPLPSRGIPYYEKLRRELRDTLQKKRLMDKNMASLEESIYRFEQTYLEETGAGNIIKGFDNYIKGSSTGSGLGMSSTLGSSLGGGAGTGGTTTRRRGQVSELDRVFSRSSAGFMRDSPTPSSAHTTPSHALTPTSSGPFANKDREKDKDGVGNASAASSVKGTTNKKNKKSAAASAAAAGGSGALIATVDANGGGRGRERDDDDDGDSNNKQPNKRLKITYGRD